MPLAAKLFVQVGGDTKEAEAALNGISAKIQGMGKQLESAGRGLSIALTAPLVLAGKQALGLAVDYSKSMNILQATSQASGKELAALDSLARELGEDLSLPATSASDAAEAMAELAKSGLSVSQIMAASRGVLQLSAAGNLSNARAAEIASNALNMFNLRGSEAVRIADLLAAGANVSSAEVDHMADSLAMAGSVFASANVPIENLVAAIAEMANSGIKGSDAGTSLKQMLLSLQAPSDKAAELMQDLGIQVYNAQGNLLPFNDLIGEFESSLSGLTQEQRNQALATIFGSDAVRAANIVLMGGKQRFDEYKQKVTEAGAAADLAAARTHGLSGKIEGMRTALETAGLAVADAAEGPFMKLLDGITNAANAFSNLDKEQQTTLTNIGIGLAALGPGLVIVGKLATGFAAVTSFAKVAGATLGAMAAKLNISMLLGGMGSLSSALPPLAALVGGAAAVWATWNKKIVETNESGQEIVSSAWSDFFARQINTGKNANQVLEEYKKRQEEVKQTLSDAGIFGKFIFNQNELTGNTASLNQALAQSSKSYEEYLDIVSQAGLSIPPLTEGLWEQTRALYGVSGAAPNTIAALRQLDEAANTSVDQQDKLTEAAQKAAEEQQRAFEEILSGAEATQSGLKGMIDQYDTLKDKMDSWLKETAGQVVSALGDKFSEASDKYKNALKELDLVMGTNYTKQLEAKTAVENLVKEYAKTGDLDNFRDGLQKIKDEGLADMQTQLEDVTLKAQELYDKLLALPSEIKIAIKFEEGGIPGWVSQYSKSPTTPTTNTGKKVWTPPEGIATGGPVMAGTPYVVGEVGPELFVPRQSGTIIPNGAFGGVTIENMVIQSAAQNGRQLFEEFKNELDAWIRSERAAGRGYAGV